MALMTAYVAAAPAPADEHRQAVAAYRRGDVVAAMTLLETPAAAGHAPSQTLLGFILERADFPEKAVALYRRAAAQDDAEAHAGLANLYLSGLGVAKDEKAAFEHFSKAAALGHATSIDVLAKVYREGGLGIAPDPTQAAVWRARAASAP